MKEIREIGIEKEIFLLDYEDNIMEPKKYGFPRDEFEFLVELRSLPSDRLYPVYTTLHQEELQYRLRANKFGMYLDDYPNRYTTTEWVDNHWKKYNLKKFDGLDYTRNIYDMDENRDTHHLGVLPYEDSVDPTLTRRLTAGIHVHFSSRNSDNGEVIQLPVEEIVKRMDFEFSSEIRFARRNLGEWEPKTHGFEYRSLPSNTNILKILKKSFKILREV